MSDTPVYNEALVKLRNILAKTEQGNDKDYQDMVTVKNEVIKRYQSVFSAEKLPQLTREEFHSFLLFENNRHWNGLHRQGPKMCADMQLLRESLILLVDETKPIDERLDKVISKIKGMGKAVSTGILLVVFPDKYGVWNNTSEGALKTLDLWPEFKHGESFGKRYVKVNDILNELSRDLNIDLWTLDALWWRLGKDDTDSPALGENTDITVSSAIYSQTQGFGLEKHLQEFLRDNWDKTELGKEWAIYSDAGDEEAGYEYPCGVGYIDILTKHRAENRWLIIELKRGQTSDKTVGQILRYMGWVKKELAEPEDKVEGLIIAHDAEDSLKYAISMVPSVSLKLYEVEFRLKECGGY